MKIASWNLFHRAGATVDEIARIVDDEKPDLFLMQEVTPAIEVLPEIAGGHFWWQPWSDKRYGMAIWSSSPLDGSSSLHLPKSPLPGIFPRRFAQVTETDGITISNVHLSHGQVLNRRQLSHIAKDADGAMVIMGDFNAVGPTILKYFEDVGPRNPTHRAQKLLPLRLDRCLVRNMKCTEARVLHPHSSDHHPIVVSLEPKVIDTHLTKSADGD
ncbi:MAG: endonuclease/exonuclease/phosphatase family protein [Rhizobiaceae bacterium]